MQNDMYYQRPIASPTKYIDPPAVRAEHFNDIYFL